MDNDQQIINEKSLKELKNEAKTLQLGHQSLPKLILSFSLTTFISLFFNSIYALTDALFVSYGVGIEAFGAISAIFPFTILQGAISTMIGGGAAILVSNLLGKQDKKTAGEIVISSAFLFWIVALMISVLGLIFLDPLLNLLGIADNLKGYAKEYLTIILICNVLSTGFSSVMRAEGKMLYALLQWVIPISVNIIFDAVLIFAFNLGVKGVAYATFLAQICGFITAMVYFFKFSSLQFKGAKFRFKHLASVLTVGLPSLIQQGSIAIGLALLNSVLNVIGGETLQITYGIINKLFTICIVPCTAVVLALQPIAGYNYGAGNISRVKSSIKYTIVISLIISLIPLIICEAMPSLLIRIFTSNASIVADGSIALRYVAISYPLLFLPSVTGAVFQAVGKKISSSILFAINFIFVPPFAWILGNYFGTNIIWLSFPLASLVSSLVAIVPLILFYRNIRIKTLEPPPLVTLSQNKQA